MKKLFLATAAAVTLTGFTFMPVDEAAASDKAKFMTEAKAQSLALQKVKGKVIEVDFDRDDRKYEFDIQTAKEEIEVEVHAVSGKVKITDREPLKKAKPQKQKLLTKEKAMAIAKSKLNGQGKVTDIELESDDGIRYYEIELKHGKKEYNVEVHAVSGKIVLFERD